MAPSNESSLEESTLDFIDNPESRRSPYPLYERLLTEAPVLRCPARGMTLVTGHAEVKGLRDERWSREERNSRSAAGSYHAGDGGIVRNLFDAMVLWRDGEPHKNLRRMITRELSARTIEQRRPQIRSMVNSLLIALEETKRTDFIEDVTTPFALNVICGMLGLPVDDPEEFLSWSQAFVSVLEPGNSGVRADEAFVECREYIRPYLKQRLSSPQDDILTAFASSEDAGMLTEDEAVAYCLFLVVAGHDTTARTLASGLYLLLTHEEQWNQVKRDDSLISKATEEILRYASAPRNLLPRWAMLDSDVAGVRVDAGEKVVGMLNAANRDPRVFTDPDTFDIHRDVNPHIAFGIGDHFCSGAALARVEIQEGLRAVLEILPDVHVAGDVRWAGAWTSQELEKLPLKWS